MRTEQDPHDARIEQEASEWFQRVRLQTLSVTERAQFVAWLAESPVHVREYLGVAAVWGALNTLDSWPTESPQELIAAAKAADANNVITLDNQSTRTDAGSLSSQTPSPNLVPKRSTIRPLAWAMGLLVIVAGVVWLAANLTADRYNTARGEQRSVVLPDGSVVQLNTLTRMIVHFDAHRRRIELPQGEAFFRVAHDLTRPFSVETPFAVVQALGTEFDVYNRVASTRVAVVEGKVEVAPREDKPHSAAEPSPQSPAKRSTRLALGPAESVEVKASGETQVAQVLPLASPSQPFPPLQLATAWMQRRLIFDNERIGDAVDEFNRYNKQRMQVADSELADLRITGVFSADDPRALMEYLRRIQGVTVRSDDQGFVLQRRR